MHKLVIHPKDKSTDFLKPIYHARNDCTVLTGGSRDDVIEGIKKHNHIIMLGHGTPQGLLSVGQFNRQKAANVKPGAFFKPKDSKLAKDSDAAVPQSLLDDLPDEEEDDWFSSRQVGASRLITAHNDWYREMSTGYAVDDSMADLLRQKKLTAIWCNADQFMEYNALPGFYTGMFISEQSEAQMIGTADTEKWQIEESNYAFVSVVRRFLDRTPEVLHSALMGEYGEMASRNAIAKYNLKRLFAVGEDDVRMASQA